MLQNMTAFFFFFEICKDLQGVLIWTHNSKGSHKTSELPHIHILRVSTQYLAILSFNVVGYGFTPDQCHCITFKVGDQNEIQWQSKKNPEMLSEKLIDQSIISKKKNLMKKNSTLTDLTISGVTVTSTVMSVMQNSDKEISLFTQ